MKAKKLVNVIVSEAFIAAAHDPARRPKGVKHEKFIAIWDTGATNTVLTRKVVDKCGLRPIGMTRTQTAGGECDVYTYLINIILRNNVEVANLIVSEGIIAGEADILIGMDIISQGDFAITNKDGATTFSFRIPSIECIDFVEQQKPSPRHAEPKIGRNEPCPCGSGRKFKHCCGR